MRGKKQKEPVGMNYAEIFNALAMLEKERNIPQSFMIGQFLATGCCWLDSGELFGPAVTMIV